MPMPSTNLIYANERRSPSCAAPASITNFAVLPIAGCPPAPSRPQRPPADRGGPRQGHGLGLGCLQTHLIVACTEYRTRPNYRAARKRCRQSPLCTRNHFDFPFSNSIIFICHAKDKRNFGLLCVLNSTLSSQLKMYTVRFTVLKRTQSSLHAHGTTCGTE